MHTMYCWLIYQRASYNHALSIVRCWRRHWRRLCSPLPATGLDIETSYLVQMSLVYAYQIFSDSDL